MKASCGRGQDDEKVVFMQWFPRCQESKGVRTVANCGRKARLRCLRWRDWRPRQVELR